MAVKAGWKGAVYLGDVPVGSGSWTYPGGTRNMVDIDQFGDEQIDQKPLQKTGADGTITGHYLLDQDAGQKALKEAYENETELTDLKLYTDYDNGIYQQVKSPGHIIITNANNVGVDKSGVGTWACTFHVNGVMEQVGSTTEVAVVTIGHVDEGNGGAGSINGVVTLIGELLHRGGETEDISCYFEYSTVESNLDNDSDADVFSTPDIGKFTDDLIELDEGIVLYYRAVALLNDNSKKYGAIKSVLIPAD